MKRLFFFYLLLFPFWLFSQSEKIDRFHATIRVDESGLLEVREEITYTTAIEGKRGIVRALPLSRKMSDGRTIQTPIEIFGVRQTNQPSPYHTESNGDNLSIYIGEKSVFLKPGTYQYEIHYSIPNQIEEFESYDEIFWNVNGSEWSFPMELVSAEVILPNSAEVIQAACYTGSYGSREQDCSIDQESALTRFSAQNQGQGKNLSIAVGFTKGVVVAVPPPNVIQKYGFQVLTFGIGFILLFYYIFTWYRFGVDPPKPTVIPQFDPPQGLSPASVAYIAKGSFSQDMITPALVNLASKGYLQISEQKKAYLFGLFKSTHFVLEKIKDATAGLPEEEKELLKDIFKSNNTIKLEGKYNPQLGAAVIKYRKNLSLQWKSLIFEGFNAKFWILPILLILFYFMLNVTMYNYFAGEGKGGFVALFILGNIVLFLIYQWLIRKPAQEKLKLRSDIEGFKMYLSAAEERQLQLFNPPEITPERFEKLLPYALALDVEEIWGEKFSQKLATSSTVESNYSPIWYHGSVGNMGRFSHSLNSSLSNSLSTASTKPSSSGGSGGGGSSGGGGGGGGGGSW